MTEEMIQVVETPTIIENEKPVKPKKVKKEISPERKAALLENLKKARLKAAENRKAKKEAKEKEKNEIKSKEKIVETVKRVNKPDPRDAELERLRNQVKNFTLQDIATKSRKKAKIIKTAATEDSDEEIENKVIPPPRKTSKKPVPEVLETPTPPQKITPPPSLPKTQAPPQPLQTKKKKAKKVYGKFLKNRR